MAEASTTLPSLTMVMSLAADHSYFSTPVAPLIIIELPALATISAFNSSWTMTSVVFQFAMPDSRPVTFMPGFRSATAVPALPSALNVVPAGTSYWRTPLGPRSTTTPPGRTVTTV